MGFKDDLRLRLVDIVDVVESTINTKVSEIAAQVDVAIDEYLGTPEVETEKPVDSKRDLKLAKMRDIGHYRDQDPGWFGGQWSYDYYPNGFSEYSTSKDPDVYRDERIESLWNNLPAAYKTAELFDQETEVGPTSAVGSDSISTIVYKVAEYIKKNNKGNNL